MISTLVSAPTTVSRGPALAHLTPPRIAELDGLRGLAIALVLVWHYLATQIPDHLGPLAYAFRSATFLTWSGVDLFFVLSGFLLGGILLDAEGSPRYFSTFYARRFFRIVPLYAIMCVGMAVALAFSVPTRVPALEALFGQSPPWYTFATFTQNFWMAATNQWGGHWLAVTWSLAVEEQFYLVLPLVLRFVRGRKLAITLFGLITLSILSRFFIFYGFPEHHLSIYLLTICRADALFLGVLGAVMYRTAWVMEWLTRNRGALRCALLALAATVAVLSFRRLGIGSFHMSTVGYTLIAVLYLLLLLYALIRPDGWIGRCLRLRWLTRLGSIAYGTYLIHMLVNFTAHGLLLGRPTHILTPLDAAVTAGALVCTLLLASLSWKYIEAPLVRYGHRFRY